MGVELLTKRYKDKIAGILSCYDRIIVQGTVPGWCYAAGMTDYFYKHQIRIRCLAVTMKAGCEIGGGSGRLRQACRWIRKTARRSTFAIAMTILAESAM